MATLGNIRKYLQHTYRDIDYLKLDIGGEEWPILKHLETHWSHLVNVKQIGMRLHLDLDKLDEQEELIRMLERRGFVRFFSRRNLWSPDVFEMAWLNGNYSQPRSNGWSEKSMNSDVFLDERARLPSTILNNKLMP